MFISCFFFCKIIYRSTNIVRGSSELNCSSTTTCLNFFVAVSDKNKMYLNRTFRHSGSGNNIPLYTDYKSF